MTYRAFKIHVLLENIRKNIDIPENICSSAFRLLTKWKRTIDDWLDERNRNRDLSPEHNPHYDDDRRSPDYDDDDNGDNHGNRNFNKRTSYNDRSRDRPRLRGGKHIQNSMDLIACEQKDNGRDLRFTGRGKPRMGGGVKTAFMQSDTKLY